MSHAAEPWSVKKMESATVIQDALGGVVAVIKGEHHVLTAERIVHCVNNYVGASTEEMATQRAAIERQIAGALKACVHDHGPLTPALLGSASKRVISNIKHYNRTQRKLRSKNGGS